MTNQFPTFRRGGERLRADVFPTFRRFGQWWWRGTCRFVRRLPLILLVLLVLLGTPWTILNIKYGRELERELSALKAQGKPLTLIEATTRPVAPEDNAAPLYQAIFGVQWLPEGKGVQTPPGLGSLSLEQMNAIEEALKDKTNTPAFRAAVRAAPPLAPVVAKLREASLRPHAVFPVNWQDGPGALFPHLHYLRKAARLLVFYARGQALQGHGDAALDALGIAVRMAGHAAEDPTLINQLVGYAMDAMVFAAAQVCLDDAAASPAAMTRLSVALSRRVYRPEFVRAMEAERTMGLDLYDWGRTKSVRELVAMLSNGEGQPGLFAVLKLYASPLGAPWRKVDELYYLHCMAQDIAVSERPSRETQGRWPEHFSGPSPVALLPIARLLMPVFARASEKCDWAQAHTELLQTALALKTYRALHGAYPASLSGLQAPADPFSGKAFVYRREGAGFRLYSLGPDLKDNKGDPIRFGRDAKGPPDATSGRDGDIVWVSRR